MANVNITKQAVTHLDPAPLPGVGTILQIRNGKVSKLGNERSGIFKKELNGRCFVGTTGLDGDEHVYHKHGGVDRALHQYASSHYADWRSEKPPHADLFDYGGFGENLVATNLTEENVCIGDLFRIGDEIIVQVSEPRSPCYKLNIRFQWPRALKRIQRTGRVGWNLRVMHSGYIEKGDKMILIDRPNPKWSVMNVKRVIQGKSVPLPLVAELTQLEVLTEMIRDMAQKRLETTPKSYALVQSVNITSRVKQLTFELKEPITLTHPEFRKFAFAQIEFGNGPGYARSYSIVAGDMYKFTLGIALDNHSRGGSAYLHNTMKLGDEVRMAPGSSPKAIEDEERFIRESCVERRIVIIGGIGVTAFVPNVKEWEANGVDYEIHYAVRDADQVAYSNVLPLDKTKIYAKSRKERLNVDAIIPKAVDGNFPARIYTCGPDALMDACKARAEKLGYPPHLLHFESFGAAAGGPRGDPFEVQVSDTDSGRTEKLEVPADKTLLQTLREAGFDMTFFCETGACGACKVNLCAGKVKHNGTALQESEMESEMLSCVDRGAGPIEIELD